MKTRPDTTENPSFTEGFWVYRGLDLGHSIKGVFAEGQPQEPSAKLGPQQRGIGKETALGKINLCRGASVFAECPPSGTRQRFFIFLNILCRGPLARPSANIPFAEGQARPSAKIFFVFWTQFFCGAIIHYWKLNFKIWANFDFFDIFP